MADHRSSAEVLFFLGSFDGAFLRFNLTHVANAGVMLGALEEAPSPIPWLAFMTATGIGLAIAARLFMAAKSQDVALRAGALLLAAGVFGNLIDRIRLGYVVDWAHVQWQVWGWRYSAPAFNLADLFIILGATLAVAALVCRWATSRGHIRARSIST
jgi:signal peptidase II